jgi:hypothetical protein
VGSFLDADLVTTMRTPSLLVGLCFASALAAQGVVVSPVSSATAEGDANNVFPFGQSTVRRYMQMHADLGTTPLVITKVSFRVNASATNYTGNRVHDIEVYMGDGTPNCVAQPNLVFDLNYATPKQTVLPRTFVTFGPTGQAVTPGPNPFTMDIVLATPFVYTGTAPLVWEVAYFGSVLTGSFSGLDADASTTATAASTVTGTGCAPTGSAALMTHTYTVNDTRGTLLMNGTITGAPANALALMAVGFTNPALPLPDLCAPLYTDATLVQVLGFTTATGTFTHDTPTGAIIAPNSAVGLPIFTQAFVFDSLSTFGLPLCASNGRSATIPAVGSAQVNEVSRLWNTVGGTTATTAFFGTSTVGYGLVTQFTHL